MGDYGRPLEFGLSLVPEAAGVLETRELAVRADALGLDLLGIQDHPYQWRFLETWILMADPEGNEFCICDNGSPASHETT